MKNLILTSLVAAFCFTANAEDFTLNIMNLERSPVQVAIVAGSPPPAPVGVWQRIAQAISYAGWKYALLSDSRQIEPGQTLTMNLPKEVGVGERWVYWDLKPIHCLNDACNYKASEKIGAKVAMNTITIKIVSMERRRELKEEPKHLIINRNRVPTADTTVTLNYGKPSDVQLPPEEVRTMTERERRAKPIIERISGAMNIHHTPRISLCFSGGGLRAMFSALGFSLGLQQTGLLDATTHAAGLSGSTWFLMKWLEQGGEPSKLAAIAGELRRSMAKGLVPEELLDPQTQAINKWAAFKQLAYGGTLDLDHDFSTQFYATRICPEGVCIDPMPTMVDLWGYFLGRRLFETKRDKYQFTLSSLAPNAEHAQMPMPIFTSVDNNDDKGFIESWTKWSWSNAEQEPPKDYRWFVVTPFSAGLLSPNLFADVPTWAMGRKYKAPIAWGATTSEKEPSYNFHPFLDTKPKPGEPPLQLASYYRLEPSATQLLGAFGSAFTVSLGEIARMMEEDLKGKAAKAEWLAIGAHYLEKGGRWLAGASQETMVPYVAPGKLQEVADRVSKDLVTSQSDRQFFNGLGLYDFYNGGNRLLELRDAGVFYNLPLPPLFNPQRNLDVIVILDVSGDLHDRTKSGASLIGNELEKFRRHPQYVPGKGLPHDLMDNDSFASKMRSIERSPNKIAVFNDPRERSYQPDEMTLIYIPTVIDPNVPALNLVPTAEFGTFKLQYTERESQRLMDYNTALAHRYEKDINEVIAAKTRRMNGL
jgi:hypothetical protein